MFKRLTTSLVNQTGRVAMMRTCSFSTHVNRLISFSSTSTSAFSYLPKRFAAGETQSAGKKAFSDFLQNEISEEVKKDAKAKAPAGWDVKADSAYCTFRKSFPDGNSIEISFSVSATVQASPVPTPDAAADKDMPLESLPPFQVRIFKPSGRVLELNCSFVEPDDAGEISDVEESGRVVKDSERLAQKPPESPTFSIDTVALKSRGQLATGTSGRSFNLSIPFADHEYYVEQDVLDEELLDHLYAFLGERGVDERFAAELVRFSSSHEHQLYVQFLRSLREFVNE